MRKQIAAANWKMNCTYQQGEKLLSDILKNKILPSLHQQVLFAVPFPYLVMAKSEVEEERGYEVAAQNCYHKKSGAYTGEVSAEMLHSIGINYCLVGHSERREYFNESNAMLAEKINLCLENHITPLFCCGEPLNIREAGTQNNYVEVQLEESFFIYLQKIFRELLSPTNLYGRLVRVKQPVRLRHRKCMPISGRSLQKNMGKRLPEVFLFYMVEV